MEKIQKGVPMPAYVSGAGRPAKYPWLTMEVGDSFAIPSPGLIHARSHCKAANKRYGHRRFEARVYNDGFRIWRVK